MHCGMPGHSVACLGPKRVAAGVGFCSIKLARLASINGPCSETAACPLKSAFLPGPVLDKSIVPAQLKLKQSPHVRHPRNMIVNFAYNRAIFDGLAQERPSGWVQTAGTANVAHSTSRL